MDYFIESMDTMAYTLCMRAHSKCARTMCDERDMLNVFLSVYVFCPDDRKGACTFFLSVSSVFFPDDRHD